MLHLRGVTKENERRRAAAGDVRNLQQSDAVLRNENPSPEQNRSVTNGPYIGGERTRPIYKAKILHKCYRCGEGAVCEKLQI